MKFLMLFVLNLFCLFCFGQQYSQCWKDVNYAGDDKAYHCMDIYLPQGEKESYPTVVLIYGSAWLSNKSKGADMNTLGKALLDNGYAVITPNHRASFDAKFPAQVHDIKAVIRFLRGNADTYKIDDSFIGITGSSSGGSLAAIMGTSRNVIEKAIGNVSVNIEGDLGDYTTYSSSVDAVVDFFGPTNMLKMDSCGGTNFIHNDAGSPASLYIGGPIQQNKEKTLLASATSYVDPTDPPFLIFHGDADRVVPHCQSEILYACLQDSSVQSSFYLVPNGQHGPGVHVYDNIKKMVDFFDAVRTKGTTAICNDKAERMHSFSVLQNDGARNVATVYFELYKKESVSLDIFSVMGNHIANYNYGFNPKGLFQKELSTAGLSSGIYFLSLSLGDEVFARKFFIQ